MVSEKPTNGEELLNNQKWSQLHWPTPGGVQTCINLSLSGITLYITPNSWSEKLIRAEILGCV